MRHSGKVAAVWCVVGGTLLAAHLPAGEDPGLWGEWEWVKVVTDGEVAPGGSLKGWRADFKGDEVVFAKRGDQDSDRFRFRLLAGTDPKGIDLTFLDGDDKGQILPCIYRLEGDTLTLCTPSISGNIGQRPAGFTPQPGNAVLILKRAKKAR